MINSIKMNCHKTTLKKFAISLFSLFILFVVFSNEVYSIEKIRNEYYISPTGNDKNPGTIEKPFRTIERARDFIREIKDKIHDDIIIYLRGGYYFIDNVIEFKEIDSGNEGKYIIYKAYKNERPVISGGKLIKSWTQDKNGLFKSKTDLKDFRQLYVNNRRVIRARTPNSGEYYKIKFWNKKDREILIKRSDIKKWNNFEQIEMIAQLNWAESFLRLKSFEVFGDYAYLQVQEPERDIIFKRFAPFKEENQPYHFENAIEFLDESGEWYFDKTNNVIYYKPCAGENLSTAEIIAPTIETLIKICGSFDKPVKNIKFEGIQFMHSTWLRPSLKGMLDVQAGQYSLEQTVDNIQYVERPPAAVYCSSAQNIIFEKNIFMHLGAAGLDLHFGTKNCVISGNIFYDISGSGVTIAKFSDPDTELHIMYNPSDKREICTDDIIKNNIISKTGQDYPGTCGIACGYPCGLTIEHNEIFDLPYTGISVGWGWKDEQNAMQNNKIRFNHIYNILKLLCDGGGIYTLSKQPGTVIERNYIHDITKSEYAIGSLNNGIFLDEGSSEITVEMNVFKNITQGNIRHNNTAKILYNKNETFDEEVIKNAGLTGEYKNLFEIYKEAIK